MEKSGKIITNTLFKFIFMAPWSAVDLNWIYMYIFLFFLVFQ
jgi:hypothetical protein